jgi:hypothetical protein
MKPNVKKLQRLCDDFNVKYPIGTEVFLKKDFQESLTKTKVRERAYVLSGHSAVAFFEGVSGSYLIDCVTPYKPELQATLNT